MNETKPKERNDGIISADSFSEAFVQNQHQRLLDRLAASASGYIQMHRFRNVEKKALRQLIEKGQVELVWHDGLRVYRLKEQQT